MWSEQAAGARDSLPEGTRQVLERSLEYLKSFPRMYPTSPDPEHPGSRSFRLEPVYRVFYLVAVGGDDVFVSAIVEEEVDLLDENQEVRPFTLPA